MEPSKQPKPETEERGMTVKEAGRRGGKKTAERHGHEFYQEIGRLGGSKGGKTTSERYGREFYQSAGKKGGQRLKELVAKAKELEGEKK